MIRNYPIGLQNFREIREEDYVYIDKTEQIYQLVTSGKFYFLSRPRRFGKSLLVDTLMELFSGSQKLFEGLWIYDKWDWKQTNPVIRISYANIGVNTMGLEAAIFNVLQWNAQRLGVTLTKQTYDQQFLELIEKASVKNKVVILIDEYDKPILDYLYDNEIVDKNRQIFKSLYSILKDAGKNIRFLLLTGVSRFSKVSIFSDLNHLKDLTQHPKFTTLTGITQRELELNFEPEISSMQQENPEVLDKIRTWYNGYSWGGPETLYNPFSLLNFMDTGGKFDNYWIRTGVPSFLINVVKKHPELYVFNDDDMKVGSGALEESFIDTINPEILLYQSGFLTVKNYDEDNLVYTLGFPNQEVRLSMLTYLTAAFSFVDAAKIQPTVSDLKNAFLYNDIDRVMKIIDTFFVKIPAPWWKGHHEAFYEGIIINSFQLLGVTMDSEVYNSQGRLDILVKTPSTIYCIELKKDKSAEKAITQIIEKEYLKPYQLDPRRKVAVGINFSSKKRAIASYLIQELV